MQTTPIAAHPAEPAQVLGFPSARPAAAYEAVLTHVSASRQAWRALGEAAREAEALGFHANLLSLSASLADDAGMLGREAPGLAAEAGELQRRCAAAARGLHAAVVATANDARDAAVPPCQAQVSLESAAAVARRLASIVREAAAVSEALRPHAQCAAQPALADAAAASDAVDRLARASAEAIYALQAPRPLAAAGAGA